MAKFREALTISNLYDLGYRGIKYTLSNKHRDGTFRKERLDRAVANSLWFGTFMDYWLEGMVARRLDHKPIHCGLVISAQKQEKRECCSGMKLAGNSSRSVET